MENDANSKLGRRSFLKLGSVSMGLFGFLPSVKDMIPQVDVPEFCQPHDKNNYNKFLNPKANIGDLTESAREMVSRDKLLDSVLKKMPTPERVVQIHDIINKHIIAEENADVAATMATLDMNPIFESIAEGKTYKGHQSVADDYARRYHGLTRKLHITNLTVDSSGAFAEMLWEGRHIKPYKKIAPVARAETFYIPMIVYYEVTAQGLIKRESVYFDQYLAALSLKIIPDFLADDNLVCRGKLLALNPGLILRLSDVDKSSKK